MKGIIRTKVKAAAMLVISLGLVLTLSACSLFDFLGADKKVAVSSVEFAEDAVTIVRTETVKPLVNILPENASNKKYEFTSSDPSVVSVEGDKITGLKKGVVTLTATSLDGGFTASCEVSVTNALFKNLRVDTDNGYPNVYVYWDGVADVEYQVKIGGTEYSQTDAEPAIAGKFKHERDGGGLFNEKYRFDATDYITDIKVSVPVSVMSLGGGDGGEGGDGGDGGDDSDYIVRYSHAVPSQAITAGYMANYYYGGNRYMSSQDDFNDIIGWGFMFGAPKPNTTVDIKVYVGSYAANAKSAAEEAVDYYQEAGSYSHLITPNGGRVVTVRLTRNSVQTPTAKSREQASTVLAAFSPNRVLTEEEKRDGDYVFKLDGDSIDPRRAGYIAETGEQLYWLCHVGVKPLPKAGSDAERLYNAAKEILRGIIGDGMTDFEKANQIYEWLSYNTVYDSLLAESKLELKEVLKNKGFYLEGVFDNNLAVCDGTAKAYTVMSRLEGIETVKVSGTAGESAATGQGHAWNKTYIDGDWYFADPTWGNIAFGYQNRTVGVVSHSYFLRTDADVFDHFENEYVDYPACVTEYGWYEKTEAEHDGQTFNFYVDTAAAGYNAKVTLLAGYLRAKTSRRGMEVYCAGNSAKISKFKTDIQRELGQSYEVVNFTVSANYFYIWKN